MASTRPAFTSIIGTTAAPIALGAGGSGTGQFTYTHNYGRTAAMVVAIDADTGGLLSTVAITQTVNAITVANNTDAAVDVILNVTWSYYSPTIRAPVAASEGTYGAGGSAGGDTAVLVTELVGTGDFTGTVELAGAGQGTGVPPPPTGAAQSVVGFLLYASGTYTASVANAMSVDISVLNADGSFTDYNVAIPLNQTGPGVYKLPGAIAVEEAFTVAAWSVVYAAVNAGGDPGSSANGTFALRLLTSEPDGGWGAKRPNLP